MCIHLNNHGQSTRSDRAVFNTTGLIWEKDPFHLAYLAACCLAIMGMLNELWSNSQLNALKGMPRGPVWKASGVKCLFFKSAANVGCFQVCYCPAGFPSQPTPPALLMWRRVEVRGDGQEKTTYVQFSIQSSKPVHSHVFHGCLVTAAEFQMKQTIAF